VTAQRTAPVKRRHETARRFEQLADELGPQTAQVEDLADLRAIAEAAERARRDEALLTGRRPC